MEKMKDKKEIIKNLNIDKNELLSYEQNEIFDNENILLKIFFRDLYSMIKN